VLVVVRRAPDKAAPGRNGDPGEQWEVGRGRDVLVRIVPSPLPSSYRYFQRSSLRRVGQVADQSPRVVGRERQVGLDDSGVTPRLEVDGPGEPKHSAPYLAIRVRHVLPERVDDPQVGLLDRLATFLLRRQAAVQPPVRVNAPAARRLDEQVAGPLGQEVPQHLEALGPVDVDPQPPGLRYRVLAAPRLAALRDADEHLLPRAFVEPDPRKLPGDGPARVLEQPSKPARVVAGAAR